MGMLKGAAPMHPIVEGRWHFNLQSGTEGKWPEVQCWVYPDIDPVC